MFQGRYFFLDTVTKQSSWTLSPKLIASSSSSSRNRSMDTANLSADDNESTSEGGISPLKLPSIFKESKPPAVGGSLDSYIKNGSNRHPNKTSSLANALRERMSRHLWPASPVTSIDQVGNTLKIISEKTVPDISRDCMSLREFDF
jgi:hypothetical protein